MIIVVDALNRERFADLVDDMFRLRARVFAGRLGWEVDVRDGKEIDRFDDLDPAYIIGLDDEGHVVACARVLQTTGPHMLSDVFHDILEGEPPMRSVKLWESTRFCVDTERLGRGRGPNTVSHATYELMIGTLEYARDSGISDIITVIDPVMDRLLKRSNNAPYGYVGSTKPMGKVSALAALLDCTDDRIGRLRDFAGIHHDVHLDEATAWHLHARGRAAVARTDRLEIRGKDLIGYCRDQIRSARNPDERAAALELVSEVARTVPMPELDNLLRLARN